MSNISKSTAVKILDRISANIPLVHKLEEVKKSDDQRVKDFGRRLNDFLRAERNIIEDDIIVSEVNNAISYGEYDNLYATMQLVFSEVK